MTFISASELEKFAYCPLSWWLSRGTDIPVPILEEGQKEHEILTEEVSKIVEHESKASVWERVVAWFAVTATILAISGALFRPLQNAEEWRGILGLLSIPWIIMGIVSFYRSAFAAEENIKLKYQQLTVLAAIIAMIIVINAVTILGIEPRIALIYEVLALVWLIAASVALYIYLKSINIASSKRNKQQIHGKILFVGTENTKSFRSERYGLSGKPNYVIEVDGESVPVEVKTGRTPRGPLFSHIIKIGAYCLLLEETGAKVTRGLLRYNDAEFEIDYDELLKNLVIEKLDEMKKIINEGIAHRNHRRINKCLSCSRRTICPEKLA
ncbi:MAG: CRISPR-associated protein Cas4 [Methanomassiliicoccales archaeon]